MKRLRIFPSVLMLVACIAVLCIGVLSIKPIENTIGGTINISAAKANIEVSCYINGQQVMAPTKTVGGVDFTIPSEYIGFDVENISDVAYAPQKILRVRIENEGNEELGAFFYNSANGLGADGLATFDSLAKELPINNAQGKQVAKATFSPYAHLAPDSYVDLYAIIELTTLSDTADSATFNFDVNVENYIYNTALSSDGANYQILVSDTRLLKLPSSIEDAESDYNATLPNLDGTREVVIPNSSMYAKSPMFYCCTQLEYLLLPQSVQTIPLHSYDGVSLKMLQTSTLNVGNQNNRLPFSAAFGGDYVSNDALKYSVTYGANTYQVQSEITALKTLIINDEEGANKLYSVDAGGTINGTAWDYMLDNIVLGPDVESLACKIPAKNVVIPAGYDSSVYTNMAINGDVENLTVADGITRLGENAFNNCTTLVSVHLPDEWWLLGNIGGDAGAGVFSGCYNIKYVNYSMYDIAEDWFNFENGKLTILGYPSGYTYQYSITWQDMGFSALVLSVEFDCSPTYLDVGWFSECYNLKEITIPESVTSIGALTFWGCYNITSIVIPEDVTTLGEGAFSQCTALKSVVIGESVRSYDGSFDGCTSLVDVTIRSPYTYTNFSNNYVFGRLGSITTVKVLASIIDGGTTGDSNLTNQTKYSRSTTPIDGYYVFTKIS